MSHEIPSLHPSDEAADRPVDEHAATPEKPQFERRFGESEETFRHRRLRTLLHELAEKLVPEESISSLWPEILPEMQKILAEQERIENSRFPRIQRFIYSAKQRFKR